ncbi:MarR family winged helix-turn-helix transcriptional regulator [Streptomyces sp. NPDC102467]|uniref:MarR family winged helix-turn-helix transcriptional regulator n=1 Tax=Streptomyces sp. NPDC102467 TaxID=3366179 RepID=UPI0038246FDC
MRGDGSEPGVPLNFTGLVTRAEKHGLVTRERSPHDGRGILLALAPKGRALVERCAAAAERRSPISRSR